MCVFKFHLSNVIIPVLYYVTVSDFMEALPLSPLLKIPELMDWRTKNDVSAVGNEGVHIVIEQ